MHDGGGRTGTQRQPVIEWQAETPMVPPRRRCPYMRAVSTTTGRPQGARPGDDRSKTVTLVENEDVGCFELSNESCKVLAEIVLAAQRKAGKGNTEAA